MTHVKQNVLNTIVANKPTTTAKTVFKKDFIPIVFLYNPAMDF